MTTAKDSYIDAVKRFNTINGFEIKLPDNDDMYETLVPLYLDKISELIKENIRYEDVRNEGFSDDHLATEIALMVFEINRKTNAKK